MMFLFRVWSSALVLVLVSNGAASDMRANMAAEQVVAGALTDSIFADVVAVAAFDTSMDNAVAALCCCTVVQAGIRLQLISIVASFLSLNDSIPADIVLTAVD